MILRKITLENKSDLEFVQKLYIESFPSNERRSVLKMHHLIDENDKFDVFVLIDEASEMRVGFITLWTFDSFIYIEHFAISREQRGKGNGAKSINTLIGNTRLPLIAEVELPSSSEYAAHRLKFYERLGFKSWGGIPYQQPPYEEGFDPVPMILLTYRDLNLFDCGESVINKIYREVYEKIL